MDAILHEAGAAPAKADAARSGAAAAKAETDAAAPPRSGRYLDVVGVSKSYRRTTVIDQLDFAVGRGELVSLLGPSGCGKTTLLRLIAGLVTADAGAIVIDGRDESKTPAHKRNVSVVFQNYALFPHLNVRDNVAFGLRARGAPRGQIAPKVDEALELVRMGELADRPVSALSGGQQQRVAVARALVVQPRLLLLDEPFSALDRKLREAMQVELKTLLRAKGITAIFVTHDQEEALAVSNRIAVMNAGRIEQFDAPGAIYARPATAFALDFVGLSSRLVGTVASIEAGSAVVDTALGPVRAPLGAAPTRTLSVGDAALVGVRPELIGLAADQSPAPDRNQVTIRVTDVMCLGSKTHVHGAAAGQDRLICELPGLVEDVAIGAEARIDWPVAETLIYPAPPAAD